MSCTPAPDASEIEVRYNKLLNEHNAYMSSIGNMTEIVDKCATSKNVEAFEYNELPSELKLLAFGIHKIVGHSMEDVLTGLPNRRYLISRLENEWRRVRRRNSAISLLMIDIDKFKNYNDSFGHHQGDVALTAVGKVLLDSAGRPGDFAARYGGEEFCVILGDTDYTGALIVAERIRAAIESMHIEAVNEKAHRITCSIGVSSKFPDDEDTQALFNEADEALYRAKDEGRS